MNNYKENRKLQDKRGLVEVAAEQWVHLVLAHLQAKKLANKKPIKINKRYEYATQ